MRNFWAKVREVEWFAVIAIILLVAAVALTLVFNTPWALAIVLAIAAVVAAIFSHRT
jgi:uncharacterized membrane protein YdbT with pleckstrin-like domain